MFHLCFIFPDQLFHTTPWVSQYPLWGYTHCTLVAMKVTTVARRAKAPWITAVRGSSLHLPVLPAPFCTNKIWLKGVQKASVGGRKFVHGGCWVHGKHATELPCLSASRSMGAGVWDGTRCPLLTVGHWPDAALFLLLLFYSLPPKSEICSLSMVPWLTNPWEV